LITIILITISTTFLAQNYNVQEGYIAEGYDLVSYFSNKVEEGSKKFEALYDGEKFRFATKENLEIFKKSPKKYLPAYGGYCAYAMGIKGKRVSIDPETFEIRDGKLYLFYNSWGINAFNSWIKEGPKKLKVNADKNWAKLK
jgi:YHS domain-containing protein